MPFVSCSLQTWTGPADPVLLPGPGPPRHAPRRVPQQPRPLPARGGAVAEHEAGGGHQPHPHLYNILYCTVLCVLYRTSTTPSLSCTVRFTRPPPSRLRY